MTTATGSVSATPTTAEVIRVAMEALLVGKFKCRPGRVESYDAARQVVSAKPMLKRRLAAAGGQEIVESMQVVSDVPVMFPRSRSFFVSFPLEAGDYVLLVGVDQSIDAFVASQEGTDVDPDDFRWWDATDVVAFPGFWPAASALGDADASNMVVGLDGGVQVHVTGTNRVEVKSSGGSAAQSAAISEKLDALYSTVITGIKAVFDTHIHVSPVGPTGTPQNVALAPVSFPTWDPAIASAKLKLED